LRRFERGLRHMNIHMPVEDAHAFFDSLDASGNGCAPTSCRYPPLAPCVDVPRARKVTRQCVTSMPNKAYDETYWRVTLSTARPALRLAPPPPPPDRAPAIGFGRIAVSETEEPNMLAVRV
jgi:hypothetical protein